jgi:hypothetical protein
MSDGPHRSLPMRNGWRKLAERAWNTNFEPTEISEAIPVAIKDDWNAEGCDQTVRELRTILEDDRQGSLFGQEREDRIDALKDVSAGGFPLRRMLIESITQAAEDGQDVATAVQTGVEHALAERIVRGALQVEEHYLRSGDEAARTIRGRIGQGVANVSLKSLTEQLMNPGSSSLPPPSKRDGLDDGPALP